MGEVQLPLKISTNYYITFATSGHYDLYDSSLLLPTSPTKLKLKFPGLPSFFKRRNSPRAKAYSPRNTKTGRWSFFAKASDNASFSHGQDSPHSSPSRVSSFGSPPSSTFSIKFGSEGGGDAREKIDAVCIASPVWDDNNDHPPEGLQEAAPTFSIKLGSEGGGDAREKIDAVCDALPVWDDYNNHPPKGLREGAPQLEVAPQVDSLMESTDVDEEEEVNGNTTEIRKKEEESLAFKLLVRMTMSNWERKLQAMSAKGRIVRLSIARMLLRAEEMSIKMRTTTVDWNGGEVRVFKGEELWYMKEVRGMRCRPLKREALYDDQKRYPVSLLDNGDVSDSALDDTKDGDEEDRLGVH